MKVAQALASSVGVAAACRALTVPRASYYRHGREADPVNPRPRPARSLNDEERQNVQDVLHSDRFVDQSPREVYATLLDEGKYLCSVRTMYRILSAADEVRERRNQLRHPQYQKPELLATAPNQVWSWDITKLLGPAKWSYFYLYVILDIFSRYVVGWMLASRESGELAQRLIRESVQKQNVLDGQLTIHSDRGPSMQSQTVAQLLATLGVTKSHSRPHVSNDNPFSESQFKTLKYRPGFPDRFGSQQHGLGFCRDFFHWYNNEHYHSGIGMLTPAVVHYGLAEETLARRQQVLNAAYAERPERFVNKAPSPPAVPAQVWINPPTNHAQQQGWLEEDCPLTETPVAFGAVGHESGVEYSLLTSATQEARFQTPSPSPAGLNKHGVPNIRSGSIGQGGEREHRDPNPPDQPQLAMTIEQPNRQHFFRPQSPHPLLGDEDEKNADQQSPRYTNFQLQVSQNR